MKKNIIKMITVFVVVMLVGCSQTSAKITTRKGVTVKDNIMTVKYASNPSTGYTWSYSFSKDGMLKVVNDKYKPKSNAKNLVGGSGYQYYSFKALKKGNVTIDLVYKRNWEGGETAKEVKLKVTIDSDKNITRVK